MRVRPAAIACTLGILLGCAPEGSRLYVDLRTDLVPGLDFDGVATIVEGGPVHDRLVRPNDVPLDGMRIAEIGGLSGAQHLTIELLRDGLALVERPVIVTVEEDTVATVVISADCREVTCEPGRACFAGRCVDARCMMEMSEFCDGATCTGTEGCPAAPTDCGENVCLASGCLFDWRTGCEEGSYCTREGRCEALPLSRVPVAVELVGDGSGHVRSVPEGIDCPGTCEAMFPIGTELSWEVVAEEGSRYVACGGGTSWDDDCDDTVEAPEELAFLFQDAAWTLESWVGAGEEGFVDGSASEARFRSIEDLALAPDGTVVVADTSNHAIRRVASDGTVTTIAGGPDVGYTDGPGDVAKLSSPHGVAVLGDSTILVADTDNNRIRAITPEGVVSTVGGSGREGLSEGPVAVADLGAPNDIIVTDDGTWWLTAQGEEVVLVLPDDRAVPADEGGWRLAVGPMGRVWGVHQRNIGRYVWDGEEAEMGAPVRSTWKAEAVLFWRGELVAEASERAGDHWLPLVPPGERLTVDASVVLPDGTLVLADDSRLYRLTAP